MKSLKDSVKVDEMSNKLRENIQHEMEIHKNTKDFQTRKHKDPLNEANNYLCKNDVYELFKVEIRNRNKKEKLNILIFVI